MKEMNIPICKYYIRPEGCKFGDKCRYRHPKWLPEFKELFEDFRENSIVRKEYERSLREKDNKYPDSFFLKLQQDYFKYPNVGDHVNWKEVKIMEEKINSMIIKFCLLGDTHGFHERINFEGIRGKDESECIFIHLGDFSDWVYWDDNLDEFEYNSKEVPKEVNEFNEFLGKLKEFDRKIVIGGNHDCGFDDCRGKGTYSMEKRQKVLSNAIYLNNSSISIQGIKIHCFAYSGKQCVDRESKKTMFPGFETKEEIRVRISKIPKDTNILLFHYPPTFHGLGNDFFSLFREMKDLRVVCFGHDHSMECVKNLGSVKFICSPAFNLIGTKIGPITCFKYYVEK